VTLPAPPRHPRRLVYLGTPAMAVPPLEALCADGFDVALVVTRPDTRRGRGSGLDPSPVKVAAEALGIPVAHRVDDLLALDPLPDLGVVVAYGALVRRHVLEVVPMVNLHFSLLPRWRGAAPVERALLAGDTETGVDLMQLEEGLDTGPVYGEVRLPITPTTTAAALRSALVAAGTDLLVSRLRGGLADPRPQQGEATYAAKIHPDELRLELSGPVALADRLVRLGGAHTTFRGQRLKVHAADVLPAPDDRALDPGLLVGDTVDLGDGRLRLVSVQPEGKKPMPVAAWRNGARPGPGERLGD
jgi:methionyl-tRNA formyltransferase